MMCSRAEKIWAQKALVEHCRHSALAATDPAERAMWTKQRFEAQRSLAILTTQGPHLIRARRSNNVFPLPVRGGVEAE